MTVGRRRHRWLVGPLAVVAVATVAASAAAADPVPGGQGTDTSLPATDSQVTVNGSGLFADLAITVNQTNHLTNQAVSITWTSGHPTAITSSFNSHYLQIMQCWGDDDGTNPANPGPPPEQCQFGSMAQPDATAPPLYPAGYAASRVISDPEWTNIDAGVGFVEQQTGHVWRPFRAVNGSVVNAHVDPKFNPTVVGGNYWLNPYFNLVTTNEIVGAATGKDGRGAELFEVQTGLQAGGLGCGQRVQPSASGERTVPKCWIVVVPRGAAIDENVGTPNRASTTEPVIASPLAPAAWQHRIAIPIEFNPADPACSLGRDERRISGSELALPAVVSWQPALCAGGNLPPFSYAPVGDATARQQLTTGGDGGPGMAVVSRPIAPASVTAANPVVYAPLSASGIVIGFNIERLVDTNVRNVPAAEKEIEGTRVAELNLTPRVVAKLLTQSYATQAMIGNADPKYTWLTANPRALGTDPDFRQFNPEFNYLRISALRETSGLAVPAGNSDAAGQLWEWILADPEARAWLDGSPDPWGMRVNPVYSTTAGLNPSGIAFGNPVPTSFPKSEPYCFQGPTVTNGGAVVVPPLLCGTDWMPYARSYADAARVARVALDGARVVFNDKARSPGDIWKRGIPQPLRTRGMLSLTDSPSAALFGVQVARLSRAGDNGSDRAFVAPDVAGLTKGVASMRAGAVPEVLEPSVTVSAPGAYPLTTLTYGAVAPLSLDAKARSDFAAFIDYSATAGQVPGPDFGQLPTGYAPLPEALLTQAVAAADVVRTLKAPSAVSTTTTTTTATAGPSTSTAAPTSAQQSPTQEAASTGNNGGASTPPRSTTKPAKQPTNAAPPTGSSTTVVASDTTLAAAPSTSPSTATTAVPGKAEAAAQGKPTPGLKVGLSRLVVPGTGIAALATALGALEVSKRPRRSALVDPDDVDEQPEED